MYCVLDFSHARNLIHKFIWQFYTIAKFLKDIFTVTGGPIIGRKNGSIFLTNRLMRTVNKIAVLWEELENLLNKPKPSYREIRPMRGRLMRGLPVRD